MKWLHIHWYRLVGMTSQPAPGFKDWSHIYRCRCGKEKLLSFSKRRW